MRWMKPLRNSDEVDIIAVEFQVRNCVCAGCQFLCVEREGI